MLRRFLVGRACLHRLPTRAGPPMDEWMKRAPRPGITSFTGFHPSFHGAPWTPAEFYKMRHMRYIIAQCELPRYSKRGLNGSVPETATKSRKSFMKRDYFSCARTTRRAFAHSLHPSTMLSLFLFCIGFPVLSREYSLSLVHTHVSFSFGFFSASNPGEPLSFQPLFFARPRYIPARTRAPRGFLTCRSNRNPRVFILDPCTPQFYSSPSSGDDSS